jgi:hypothetical protein
MSEWLLPLGVLALWLVLARWVLPRMGVPTGVGGSCAASPHPAAERPRPTGDPSHTSDLPTDPGEGMKR